MSRASRRDYPQRQKTDTHLKALLPKWTPQEVGPLMWVLTPLFVLRHAYLDIE